MLKTRHKNSSYPRTTCQIASKAVIQHETTMTGTNSSKQNQGLLLVQKPRILRAHVRSTKRRFVRFGNASNCKNNFSDLHRIQKIDFELVQLDNGLSVRPKERKFAKDSQCDAPSNSLNIDIDLKLLQRRQQRITKHVNKVLDEQLDQWESSSYDPENLARVSHSESFDSLKDALARGRLDATAVYGKFESI